MLSVNASVFYMSSLTQSEVERSHACTFALSWYIRLYSEWNTSPGRLIPSQFQSNFLRFLFFNNIPQSSQCFLLWAEILTEALTVVTTHETKAELDICDLLNNSLPEPNISRKQLFSCSLCRWNATCMTCLMSLKRTICQGKAKASISYESYAVAYLITDFIPCHKPNQKVFFFSKVKTRRHTIHEGLNAVPSEKHCIAFPAGAINRCTERKNTIRKTNGRLVLLTLTQDLEWEMWTWRHENQWCRLMQKINLAGFIMYWFTQDPSMLQMFELLIWCMC